ncbi:MAG: hypothetical protein R3E66_22955 [bacterium]
MAIAAVLDARHLDGGWGLSRKIAGLTLVQRAVRMVSVNGVSDIIIWASEANADAVRAEAARAKTRQLSTVVTHFGGLKAAVGVVSEVLILDVRTVFHRGMIKDLAALPVAEPTALKVGARWWMRC